MSNLIAKISQAEQEAEQIKKDANAQAREILKAAAEAIKLITTQALLDARELAHKNQETLEAQIEVQMQAQREVALEKVDLDLQSAHNKLGIASAFIYERVVSNG